MSIFNINDININNSDFTDKILKEPVPDKNSIVIELDNYTLNELFEKLVLLYKEIMLYFYSDKDNIEDLPYQNQIQKVNLYFNSFGININFKNVSLINLSAYEKFITDIDEKNINYKNDNDCKIELIDMLDYKYISNYNLSDKRFRIIRNNTAYIIWFTYLIH